MRKETIAAWDKLCKTDWTSPVPVLIIAAIALAIYTGGHFLKVGLFLGVGMSLGMIIILEKSPRVIRNLIRKNPMTSDLVLSSLATMLVAGYFGTGLTLGIGAVTCGLALSWSLPRLKK